MSKMENQSLEFAAAKRFGEQTRRLALTAVVDDDYPEVRHDYESALSSLIDALKVNRPEWMEIARSPDDSISRISKINLLRCERWHPNGLGSWSYADWAVALAGEVGELCNVVKKMNRLRDGLTGNKESPSKLMDALWREVADVYLYLDLFAQRAGINLFFAIRTKFNETSEKNGFPERLE